MPQTPPPPSNNKPSTPPPPPPKPTPSGNTSAGNSSTGSKTETAIDREAKAAFDRMDADAAAAGYTKVAGWTTKTTYNPNSVESQMRRRQAERDEFNAAENKFGYKPPGAKPPSKWRKRRNIISGGVAGGVIGIVMAVFGFLSPFKVPALLQAAADEAGQRVEQVTVHRAKVILARAILSKLGSPGGAVITGNGPVSSLIASMRTNSFEKRLAAKGLVIEATPDGVKLKMNGKPLGGGKALKNEAAIMEALDADRLSNKMLNNLIKEDMPVWRWAKRAKFAKWMRIKYHISRYGVKNSDEKDPEKRAQKMQETRLTESYNRSAQTATDGIGCILGEDGCELKDGEKDVKPSDAGQVGEDLKGAGEEVAKVAGKTPLSQMRALTGLLAKTVVGKFATKAIPIVGWIDLVATIDHIAYTALHDDYFAKIPAFFRERSYAQAYGDWQGYADQQKDGAMDAGFAGVLAVQADGAEKSCAWDYINRGVTAVSHVQFSKPRGECLNEDEKINSNNPSGIHKTWEKFKNIPGVPANTTSHFVLNIYYETIGGGGLLGWLGNIAGSLISAGLSWATPDFIEKWFLSIVTTLFTKILDLVGLTVDPLDAGAKLFNNIHAGATASYNTFCKEFGCRLLTVKQANEQNQLMAIERSQELADSGWFNATFNPSVNTSITNQLAIALPASLSPTSFDATTGVSQLASLVASLPSRMFATLTGKVHADTVYVDLYGVDPYGSLASDRSQPVAPEAISGDECPKVAEGDYDNCKVDKWVAESMICSFTPEDPDCNFIGSGAPATSTTTPGGPGSTDPPAASGLGWPIAKAAYKPLSNCYRKPGHTGIDIPVPVGTPVYAAAAGTVVKTDPGGSSDGGKYIIIKHADGHWTNYQHLSSITVSVGATVTAGQQIALSGNTGFSTGAHLHFSVTTREGLDSRASVSYSLNPLQFLPKDGRSLGVCG